MNTAQARAQEIRHRYRFKRPSDIERVLYAENIQVTRFPLTGRLEEIVVLNQVAIRDSIKDVRHIFELLAHALGHYLLHAGNQMDLLAPPHTMLAEKWEHQAWDFAFELLMPAQKVETLLQSGWSEDDLREAFEVSTEFYQRRMQALQREYAQLFFLQDAADLLP
jgi:Zn-dependent peptidase ImmA (M78 family)